MKALNHPINEHIYAALITGHSRAGDMAGLQQVGMAVMMSPSYWALSGGRYDWLTAGGEGEL